MALNLYGYLIVQYFISSVVYIPLLLKPRIEKYHKLQFKTL